MKKKRGRGMKVSAMREERARGGFNRKETGGGRTLQFICFALSLFLSVPAPHPMKKKKKRADSGGRAAAEVSALSFDRERGEGREEI